MKKDKQKKKLIMGNSRKTRKNKSENPGKKDPGKTTKKKRKKHCENEI